MNKVLLHYLPELIITIAIWVIVGWQLGFSALLLTVILSILEITLSADNAVLNARVLMRLSVFWQRMFLTVGIIFAVFIVRFILPIVMVAVATGLDIGYIFSLAVNNPDAYSHKLHDVAPLINSFGGMFLLLVGLFFFVDSERKTRELWFKSVEGFLRRLGQYRLVKWAVIAIVVGSIVMLVPVQLRLQVALALGSSILLYILLHAITTGMARFSKKTTHSKEVGWAAFTLFMYLQVLDASFSLDGVIGAFALTNHIFIIMAGLGIGALWVRTMTIYMVRHDTLMKYQFLESGAHWAILALSVIMLLKLFHIELPELVIGTIGLVFVAGAVAQSIKINKVKSR